MKKHKKWLPAVCIAGCVILVYLCTMLGSAGVSFADANRVLLQKLFGLSAGETSPTAGQIAIVWNVRLPRILTAFLTGGALALCGASFQGIFKNPMADPYVLGVSSGAALGAAVGIVLKLNKTLFGMGGTALLAFAGALLTAFTVCLIARSGKRMPVTGLLLAGIAIGQTASAVMSLLMLLNIKNMNQILFWSLGSLNGSGWNTVLTVLPFVVCGSAVLFASSREMDVMLLGEDTAVQLGVNSERLKRRVILASSVMVAAVVSVTGVIGFVGLIVPHIVRLLSGSKHRTLLPFSLVCGGAFLVLCDTLARCSTEIPVGIVTACFGGPFFVFLLWQKKKGGLR